MAAKDEERERRLAAALRENLRRRKAQARAIAPAGAKAGEEPAPRFDPDGPRTDDAS